MPGTTSSRSRIRPALSERTIRLRTSVMLGFSPVRVATPCRTFAMGVYGVAGFAPVSTARRQVAVPARWLPGLGRRSPGVGSWHWIKLALRLITRRAKKDDQVDLESAGGGDVEIEKTVIWAGARY